MRKMKFTRYYLYLISITTCEKRRNEERSTIITYILYLYFMQKLLLFGLLLLAFTSCQPDETTGRQVDPATDVARLKTALHERKSQDGLVPVSDSVLREILPARMRGFAFVDTKSGSFQERFSEVERVYFQENGHYVHSRLADYQATPEAFEQIWEGYETARKTEKGHIVDPNIQHFCWQQSDTLAKVVQRECGLMYRFHLQLRSNHPKADSLFNALQAILALPTTTP